MVKLFKSLLVLTFILLMPLSVSAKEKGEVVIPQTNSESTMDFSSGNSGEISTQSSVVKGSWGYARLYSYDNGNTLWWNIEPSYPKGYTYYLTIDITNLSTGKVVDTLDIVGVSTAGSESDYEDVSYLGAGIYYAKLSGYALHTDGSVSTVSSPGPDTTFTQSN